LGLGTIAEGIETIEQLNCLKSMQCKYGQGWLFSKALGREKIEAYLKDTFSPCQAGENVFSPSFLRAGDE
jgi:sensor c-di-GMP phosphodiesterase-like protein